VSGSESRETEQASHETLQDRTCAWWTTVLVGQLSGSHPVHGTDIHAELQGDTLVVTGTVPTAQDRHDIEAEVAHLQGKGFTTLQNDLVVGADSEDQAGLLTQTLVAAFENPETAAFAQSYLTEHAHVHPERLLVVAPTDRAAADHLVALLPDANRDDAQRALTAGRTLVVVTVDETEAFKTRELLDEETRSLETLVLPPAAAPDWRAVAAAAHGDDKRGVAGSVPTPDAARRSAR